MKELHVLFGNRPLAAVSATDLNIDHHVNMIDELLAIKLGFVIRDLQYARIKLSTNNISKNTRITGRTRATLQVIQQGRPGGSLAFSGVVVRDLLLLTGAEAIVDSTFQEKFLSLKKEESGRDTTVAKPSSADPSNLKESASVDANVPNIQASKAKAGKILSQPGQEQSLRDDEESSCYESSYRSSESDSSECTVYSSCSSEDEADPHKHRMRCTPHNEAHIGRVRGRNKKLLDEARSNVTEDAIEAERMRQDSLAQRHPDAILDECFPGGAKFAHHLSDRWAQEEKMKEYSLKRLKELDSIQSSMIKKKKRKKLKSKYGLTERDFQMRKEARKFKSDSD